MNTSNNYDSIEQLIFESGLRITSVAFLKSENLMTIFLNTGNSLPFPITDFKLLAPATEEQLSSYTLISNGIGVHWPALDEDLSLKGFLREELKKLTGITNKNPDGNSNYAMAA